MGIEFTDNSMSSVFFSKADELRYKPVVAYREDTSYVDITWLQLQEMVIKTAKYLKNEGVKKGTRVSIYSDNRYEWWVADLAINTIGAISVPIHATSAEDTTTYILKNSEAEFCFIDNDEKYEIVKKNKRKLPKLKKFILFNSVDKKLKNLTDFKTVQETTFTDKEAERFFTSSSKLKPEDTATLIYTSGTTGDPKGVMLSNSNFTSNVSQLYTVMNPFVNNEEIFLSFLPLSHVLERTAGYYLPIVLGAKVYFAKSITTIQQDLAEVQPTILISVPRIYEKVHAAILEKAEKASGIKKLIFNFSQKVAEKNAPNICKSKTPKGPFAIKLNAAEKLVFSKMKTALGMSRLKFAVSGGGPLNVSDANFFLGMGIRVLEGFGLTETSPVTNVTIPNHIKPGSVGPALPNTEIRISDEGEIQIKGPQVMKGYYKNNKATKEVFTKDGFFRSGDIGVVDEDGFLFITGRIKDIIVTSGGKNISPQPIENEIKSSKYIAQVAIIGDKRKYLSALVIPEFEEIKKYASKNSIKFTDMNDLVNDKRIYDLISTEVNNATEKFSRVEQLKKIKVLPEEWTIEGGELTASLKVKRKVVEEKYNDVIDQIYAEDE